MCIRDSPQGARAVRGPEDEGGADARNQSHDAVEEAAPVRARDGVMSPGRSLGRSRLRMEAYRATRARRITSLLIRMIVRLMGVRAARSASLRPPRCPELGFGDP